MFLALAFICFSVVMISHTLMTMRGACCHCAWLMKIISKYLSNKDREGRNESQGTLQLLCVLLHEKKCKLCHVKLGFEKMLEKLRGRPWGWDSFNSGMLSAESKSKGVG